MHAVSGARWIKVGWERRRALLPLLVGAVLIACASGGVGATTAGSERSGALVVQNNSWKPVTLFLSRNGEFRRLGEVEAAGARVFSVDQLPFAVEGRDVYLVGRPVAGETFRSEPFAFSLARTTVWTIENKTAMSRLAVR
jgi:hypothetical protein